MVENKIQEEILYREGLQMGLDKDDTIVKRRMAQKMQFLAEDVAAAHEPSTQELKAWFAEERGEIRAAGPRHLPARILRLRQARAERPEGRRGRAAQARGQAGEFPARRGDGGCLHVRGLLRRPHGGAARQRVRPDLRGRDIRLKPGAWSGPLESGYGWHLVFIDSIIPGRIPEFEEVEPDVQHRVAGRAKGSRPGRRRTRACVRGTRCCCPQPQPPRARPRASRRAKSCCPRRPRPSDAQRRRFGPGCALWLLLAALCVSAAAARTRRDPVTWRSPKTRPCSTRSCGARRCSPACACRSRCGCPPGSKTSGPRGAGTQRLTPRASLDFRRSAGPGGAAHRVRRAAGDDHRRTGAREAAGWPRVVAHRASLAVRTSRSQRPRVTGASWPRTSRTASATSPSAPTTCCSCSGCC